MGQTLRVPLKALTVVPDEISVSMDSGRLSPDEQAAIEEKYRQQLISEPAPLTANLDQLQVEPPPQAPQETGMLAKATGLGPMIGGTIGALGIGGPVGAGLGGAAGEGYEDLIRHATEIPGAVSDVTRNIFTQPVATFRGARQGIQEGAVTAGLAGGVNAALEAGGQKAMDLLGAAAKGVYRGYLKPSLAGVSKAKAQGIVDAAIQEGLPIAQIGKDRADQIIKELRGEVDTILSNRQHISQTLYGDIDLHQVADRVRQFARNKYYKMGRPVEDFEAAMKVADNIDAHPSLNLPGGSVPGPTPVDLTTANEVKRTLQQSAGDRAFGVERSAATEAEKKGQYILRKDLETRASRIAPLNARESKLIDVAKALQSAIEREANHNAVYGVKTIAAGAMGGETYRRTNNPAVAIATALTARWALAPAQMSRIAILAERLSRVPGVAPTTAARVAIATLSESQR